MENQVEQLTHSLFVIRGGPENGRFLKAVERGCKMSFGPREHNSAKSLLHYEKPISHPCNPILHWCKTLFAAWARKTYLPSLIGRCPSTVPPVFPVLVFQLSKQQNRTRTTFSTVLGTPPNRTRTKKFPLEELWGGCFVSWALNWESTENWDFHSWEPYTEPYSDTSWS